VKNPLKVLLKPFTGALRGAGKVATDSAAQAIFENLARFLEKLDEEDTLEGISSDLLEGIAASVAEYEIQFTIRLKRREKTEKET